jgi:hypothetical protein
MTAWPWPGLTAGSQQWATGDYTGGMKHLDEAIRTAEALNPAHPNDWDILQELGSDYHSSGVIQTPSYSGGPADAAKDGCAFGHIVGEGGCDIRITRQRLVGIRSQLRGDLR